MPIIKQTSFAGGEISPSLYGRTDLEKYGISLKRMRNWFASRQGAAVSRPGTTYVNEVKASADGRVRLIPFIYSDTVSFVLEFGHNYIRFYTNGAVVMSGMSPLEVVTTYSVGELPSLKYAQQGAVLTLTLSGHAPAELTYGGGTSWTLGDISFLKPDPVAAETLSASLVTPIPVYQGAWSGATTYNLNDIATYQGANYRSAVAGNIGNAPDGTAGSVGAWVLDETATNRAWKWAVTGLHKLASGLVLETQPVIVLGPTSPYKLLSQTVPQTIQSVYAVGSTTLMALRVFRGLENLFGLVGVVAPGNVGPPGHAASAGNAYFTDNGDLPDYSQEPPQGYNPFTGASARWYKANLWSPPAPDYPSCVAFFEQRRCFARTNLRVDTLFMSAINDYYDFDLPLISNPSSSVQFAIASRKREEIRAIVHVGPKLLAFTNSSIWAIGGGGAQPIQFDSIDCKRQGEVGSSWVDPLVVDGTALFIRTKGTGVRSLTEDLVRQSFVSLDMSILASHLFVGHSISDWAHAEDPWGLIWAARDDGVLLSFTYVKDHDIWAWARHDSPGGTTPGAESSTTGLFENVCSVPEGSEDAVYFVVNRTINSVAVRYIERLATRVVTATNGDKLVALDCSGIYNGAPTTSITGLTWLVGQSVYVVADGSVQGPFTVDNSGNITLGVAASYVITGLAYTPEIQQLNVALAGAEVKTIEKQVSRVGFEVDNARGLQVGPDFDDLDEWTQRQVADAYAPISLSSELVRQYVLGNWGTDGDVCIRQTQPLPVTIISLTREVQLGDAP